MYLGGDVGSGSKKGYLYLCPPMRLGRRICRKQCHLG